MNRSKARSNIMESMESGAARILDQSKMLEPDQLVRVAVRAKAGDQHAWDELVNGMSRLIFKLGETYYYKWSSHLPPNAAFCDVFSEGLVGLQKATMKFEADRGYAFTTPATWWIRNAVQRACYSLIGITHIPEKELLKGIAPSDAIIQSLSLEYQGPSNLIGDRPLHETLADTRDEEVVDFVRVRDILEVLEEIDRRLPMIVTYVQRDYSMREIGRIIGVTGDRVGQLLERGQVELTRAGYAPSS